MVSISISGQVQRLEVWTPSEGSVRERGAEGGPAGPASLLYCCGDLSLVFAHDVEGQEGWLSWENQAVVALPSLCFTF